MFIGGSHWYVEFLVHYTVAEIYRDVIAEMLRNSADFVYESALAFIHA